MFQWKKSLQTSPVKDKRILWFWPHTCALLIVLVDRSWRFRKQCSKWLSIRHTLYDALMVWHSTTERERWKIYKSFWGKQNATGKLRDHLHLSWQIILSSFLTSIGCRINPQIVFGTADRWVSLYTHSDFCVFCRKTCKHATRGVPSWRLTCIHAIVSRSPWGHGWVAPDKQHCKQWTSSLFLWIFA